MTDVELGLHTFGDVTATAAGALESQAQVIRHVVAEGVLADQLGLDFFGVGEHHREDFAVSAPDVVLSAIAAQTGRIRLGSAVTVLSSDDPVRVFERFSTLDAVSSGRAEVILGRGSFIESFPLFGYALEDYEQLFEEKLELFAGVTRRDARDLVGDDPRAVARAERLPADGVRRPAHVDRRGRHSAVGRARGALRLAADARDHRRGADALRSLRRPVPACAGGVRAGHASCGRPLARRRGSHRRAGARRAGPHDAETHARIGRERGWPPMTREQYDAGAGPSGALFVGSPETVATKIVKVVRGLACPAST